MICEGGARLFGQGMELRGEELRTRQDRLGFAGVIDEPRSIRLRFQGVRA
jgi:hypothetical protein